MPRETCLERARVEPMDISAHPGFEQRAVGDGEQVLGDEPDILLRGHPVAGVEAPQVDGVRVRPQRAIAPQIEVRLEVAQGELAQRAELAQLARRENVGHRPQSAPTASSSPSFLIAGLVTVNSTTPPTGAVIVASGSPTRSVTSPTTSSFFTS